MILCKTAFPAFSFCFPTSAIQTRITQPTHRCAFAFTLGPPFVRTGTGVQTDDWTNYRETDLSDYLTPTNSMGR